MWRKGKLRKEGRVWCVEGGGWADADESWVLRGLGAGVGVGGGRWVGSDDWLECEGEHNG